MNKQDALEQLHEMVKPGDVIYTKLNHVSQSGMTRAISFYIIQDNQPYNIDYLVAPASEYNIDRYWGGLRVSGCGMDMGFAVVYDLSYNLWPDGFGCIGEHCPANDHLNGVDCKHHRDGGYALKQRWL